MKIYKDWRPSHFDAAGLGCDNRQDWLVAPVIQTRDSGPREQSNFLTTLEQIGGVSDDVEIHRFGHWGPGWFEIILVRPDTKAAKEAEGIEAALADYPILDENDLSEREMECVSESWECWGVREMRELLREEYSQSSDRWDAVPAEVLYDAYVRACETFNCGEYYRVEDGGEVVFFFDDVFERANMRGFVLRAIHEHRTASKKKAA